MQPSTALCLALLHARRVVCNLTQEDFALPKLGHLLTKLQQLGQDLLAAASKVTPAQFTSSAADTKQHLQLLQSSTELIASLVAKLTELEATPQTADMSQVVCSSNIAQHAYSSMMFLLHICTQTFSSWPGTWPVLDAAQYAPMREALHSLVRFMHASTRNRRSRWYLVLGGLSISSSLLADVLFAVPLSYIISITEWPGSKSRMIEEVAALPCEFFSLACCILLGLVDEEETLICKTEAANSQSTSPSAPILQSGLVSSILILGYLLDRILDAIITAGATTQLSLRLTTPAVIMLFKYIVILCPSTQDQQDVEAADCAMRFLIHSLKVSVMFNDLTANTPSLEQCLWKLGSSSVSLLPQYRPRTPVSDVRLMRVLLTHVHDSASNTQLRHGLVASILKGWQDDGVEYTPFPSPSAHEQVRGTLMVLQHCLASSKSWLLHQLHIRQGLDTSACCPPAQQTMTEEMHEIAEVVSMNRSMTRSLAAFVIDNGGCDAGKRFISCDAVVSHSILQSCSSHSTCNVSCQNISTCMTSS